MGTASPGVSLKVWRLVALSEEGPGGNRETERGLSKGA